MIGFILFLPCRLLGWLRSAGEEAEVMYERTFVIADRLAGEPNEVLDRLPGERQSSNDRGKGPMRNPRSQKRKP